MTLILTVLVFGVGLERVGWWWTTVRLVVGWCWLGGWVVVVRAAGSIPRSEGIDWVVCWNWWFAGLDHRCDDERKEAGWDVCRGGAIYLFLAFPSRIAQTGPIWGGVAARSGRACLMRALGWDSAFLRAIKLHPFPDHAWIRTLEVWGGVAAGLSFSGRRPLGKCGES